MISSQQWQINCWEIDSELFDWEELTWIMILAVKYFQADIKGHPIVEHCLYSKWVTLSAHHPLTCLWFGANYREHSVFYRVLFCSVSLLKELCVMHWLKQNSVNFVGKEERKEGKERERKRSKMKKRKNRREEE